MNNYSMTTDILDVIINEDPFEHLRYLNKEDYHLVGLSEDSKFIKDGWEVYMAGTDDSWYFLYHPERHLISMRFTRKSCLYGTLKKRCIRAKTEAKVSTKPTGLGDRVERIAQPIARVIDKVAGTNIQGCKACQKRKEYLNKKFPET